MTMIDETNKIKNNTAKFIFIVIRDGKETFMCLLHTKDTIFRPINLQFPFTYKQITYSNLVQVLS